MRRHRIFDWRLFAAIGGLLLVGYVVWSGVQAGNRADDALATMKQHDQAAQRDRDQATEAARAAARDRRIAALNQQALLAYTKAIAAQQAAENQWLINHHFPVPQRFLTVIRPPRIVVHHPRASHHVRRRHRATTSSTAPTGPGKSGHAPGHTKHPRHGRRHR